MRPSRWPFRCAEVQMSQQYQTRGSILNSAATVEIPEILTAKELEAFLRIDVKTIYGYVQRGLIPYVRIQSNLRFRKQDVLDWLDDHSYSLQRASNGRAKSIR